ncbi:hypothetical protein G7Y79_00036g071910 [Physcia stellaris]|nr:hypothetical protein G7Y79_00036g071910 [Physcia stellaris]
MYLKSWAYFASSGLVFVEASVNNISQTIGHAITSRPLVTPEPTASSCWGCTYNRKVLRGFWDTNEIYTQTAALVELIIDDSTNTTSTSTIRNASLPSPTYTIDNSVVNGSVATLTLGSLTTYMTYPTWYDIFYNFSATFQSLATITGNGTSSVICTGEWKHYSEAFANTTEGPNGDYSPSTVVDALNAFTSSAFPGCTLEARAIVAAPSTKVRVSQVTATSTRHVATGVKPLPDAGIGFSVESEGSDVSDSSASGASCGDHGVTYTHTSGLDVTIGCFGASSGPVVHATVTDGLHPTPSETQQQIGVESETKKPGYSDINLPFFGPIEIHPTERPSPLPTPSPGSGGDSGSQPVVALPVTQSPSEGQGGYNSQDGSNGRVGQIGANDQGESSGQDGLSGQIGSSGQSESNGQGGSGDQNQSSGPDESNGQNGSNGQIASNSQNGYNDQGASDGQGESNGQDYSNGQSGSNSQNGANDQGGSNGQNGSNGQDVSNLPSPTVITPPAQITVGSQTYTANPSSQFVVGSQTLEAGGDAVTHEGHTISLGPSASNIVIDSSTGVISYPIDTTLLPTALPVLTIDNQPVTANDASEYIIGSQTLIPGGSAITISGTPVSLAPSESAIVIGSKTETISHLPITTPKPTSAAILTINNQLITANGASEYIIGSQTLIPGGPAITVSGTLISLAPSASAIVIDGSTKSIPTPSVTSAPVLTINNQPVTANSASEYIIGSQTLIPGGPAITVSGTLISLAPSASAVVIGDSTEILSSPSVTAAPVLTINNQPVTANSASEYIIQGQTLIPGGPAITVSGTPISLAPSASDVVVGSSTEALGSIIMGGFGPSDATAGSIGSGSANSTTTTPEAFTGGAGLMRKIKVSRVVAVGLGIGMVMAFTG